MSNGRVIPFCLNKSLLFKVDTEVLNEGKGRNKGRTFNRSKFICDALEYYLEKVCYKKVNYFKKAEEKLERAFKR